VVLLALQYKRLKPSDWALDQTIAFDQPGSRAAGGLAVAAT
jgi:hypothetical protein